MAPVAQAAPAAKSGGGLMMKLILAFVALFFVMGIAGVFGVWWVGTKVKEKAREYGVDVGSGSSRRPPSAARSAALKDPCQLYSNEEVTALVGYAVVRTEKMSPEGCNYFASEADADKMSAAMVAQADQARKDADAKNSPDEAVKFGESVIKGMMAQRERGTLLLGFTITREGGGSAMMAAKMVQGLNKGLPAQGVMQTIEGLGDRAILLPMNTGLIVQKGDLAFTVSVGSVPDAKEKLMQAARKLLERI